MPDTEKYPESAKLLAVSEESQTIGAFLDQMAQSKGAYLTAWVERDTEEFCGGTMYNGCDEGNQLDINGKRTGRNCRKCEGRGTYTHHFEGFERVGTIESVLSDYYGIDQRKLEEERRAMLDSMREANADKDWRQDKK